MKLILWMYKQMPSVDITSMWRRLWFSADDIFKPIVLNENSCILVKVSLMFDPKGLTDLHNWQWWIYFQMQVNIVVWFCRYFISCGILELITAKSHTRTFDILATLACDFVWTHMVSLSVMCCLQSVHWSWIANDTLVYRPLLMAVILNKATLV